MTAPTRMRKPELLEEVRRLTERIKVLKEENEGLMGLPKKEEAEIAELKIENANLVEKNFVLEKEGKKIVEEKGFGTEDILAKAKKLKLFVHNRELKRYEINISSGEFEKI